MHEDEPICAPAAPDAAAAQFYADAIHSVFGPDRFSIWDWPQDLTPRQLCQEAIRKLQRTSATSSGGTQTTLYNLLEWLLPSDRHDGTLDSPLPRFDHLAIYAVEGESEGHSVHVGLVLPGERFRLLMHAKTFEGLGAALEVTSALTRYFNQ